MVRIYWIYIAYVLLQNLQLRPVVVTGQRIFHDLENKNTLIASMQLSGWLLPSSSSSWAEGISQSQSGASTSSPLLLQSSTSYIYTAEKHSHITLKTQTQTWSFTDTGDKASIFIPCHCYSDHERRELRSKAAYWTSHLRTWEYSQPSTTSGTVVPFLCVYLLICYMRRKYLKAASDI